MANQTGKINSNLITNVLLGLISILLIVLIALFAYSQYNDTAQARADATKRDAQVEKITQMSQENQTAIDDLYSDYIRDRGYVTEKETDYLLKRALVGDEYIIHGLMFLATQNNQILQLLGEMK